MVVEFNHEDYDVVGVVRKPHLGSTNTLLDVVGISDRSTGEFIPLSKDEALKMFSTRGCVFAHDFFGKNMNFVNECVCIRVIPNANLTIINGDDFIWDKSQTPYVYAHKVKTLKSGLLGFDGDSNHKYLEEAKLLDSTDTEYLFSSNRIYRIEPRGARSRLLPYWDINDTSLAILEFNGKYFIYDNIISNPEGYVDIMNDEQLLEWFVKNVLKKEWSDIYENKDFKKIEDLVKNALRKLKLPTDIYEHRLSKMASINSNLSLTFSELEDIGTSPWFADAVKAAMSEFADEYIEKVKAQNVAELRKLQEEHTFNIGFENEKYSDELKKLKESFDLKVIENNINLLELDERIKEKKDELNTAEEKVEERIKDKKAELTRAENALKAVEETIVSKHNEVVKLENRKASIIEDFSIIKEVMGMETNSNATSCNNRKFYLEEVDQNDERAIPRVQPFKKNLESSLITSLSPKVSVNEIVSRLATYNILLLPETSVVMGIVLATRRCKYLTEYVGVDWKSFNDLWENGLEFIVQECKKDDDMIHFLILQHINMSYIPSYMQPLFDLEMGLISKFPNSDLEYPSNLKILCTVSDDEVIPISRKTLELIGCVAIGEDISLQERVDRHKSLDINSAFAMGYLTSSVMREFEPEDAYILNNSVDSYINAEE